MINLNLLPLKEKKLIWQKKILDQFLFYEGIILFAFVFLIILLQITQLAITWELFLPQQKLKETLNPQTIINQEKLLNQQIKKTNYLIDEITYFQKKQKKWSQPINQLIQDIPPSLHISSLQLIKQNKITHHPKSKKIVIVTEQKIIIRGIAESRKSLINTENLLKENNCFQKIDSPISNYLKKNQIEFSFEIFPQEKCLH